MSNITRLIIDGSSICWYGLRAGKDEEFGQKVEHEGKIVLVNGWQYGYENAINSVVAAWRKTGIQPKDTILVEESGNTKGLRKQWLPTYKDGTPSPEQAYEQFNILREKLSEAIRSLGGVVVTRPHMEGDDIIGYLVSNMRGNKIVQTQDRDLAVLLDRSDTKIWRSSALLEENPYGPFSPKLLPVYKALVGDTSDKIPGARGFGDKAFLNLLAMFGEEGVEEVGNMIVEGRLKELEANVGDLKALKTVLDNADTVVASYKAGLLYPELVENMRVPLIWSPGFVKQRSEIADERLWPYAGAIRLVNKANYQTAKSWAAPLIAESDYVALDIETSTPEESDEWLRNIKSGGKAAEDEDLGVDVLGSELTGLSITFGKNQQYTVYLTHEHVEADGNENLTLDQVREFVSLIPQDKEIAVQNVAFELPVLYMEWGDKWKDNGWHGFLPNTIDTKIMASYVDENSSTGLKKLSKKWFDYDQQTYAEVTGGRKMNELTANEVLSYGADDTIMTSALYSFFKVVMECEGTYDAFEQVEQLPAYLTAYAFVKGFKFSLEEMRRIEREDAENYAKHEAVLNDYLIANGWEGTVCPEYTATDLVTPAKIKEIYNFITGDELKTMLRTPEKIYTLIRATGDSGGSPLAETLAEKLEDLDVEGINAWVARKFNGSPVLDISSPKQMRTLLYDVMKIQPRIVNPLTENERENKRELAEAVWTFNKFYRGTSRTEPTPEQWELIKQKATADRYAVEFAIAFDGKDNPEIVPVLKAIQEMSKITTRQNLFYAKYPLVVHWKTGRIHAHINQCATVTRRYSSSGPNIQQLSKKGEGVKVRGIIVPHKPGAWIISNDFSGQELRLGADQSQDINMLSCYVGDKLRDIHSIVAASPQMLKRIPDLHEMAERYGFDLVDADGDKLYEFFRHVYENVESGHPDYKLMDDIRKVAKNVVFGTQYDAQAPTLAKNLTSTVPEAQTLLEAKKAMFPRYDEWKDEEVAKLRRRGFVTTYLGARRHLRTGLLSPNRWEVEKAERQGPNMMIQGSAAEQTKLVMAEIWRRGIFFRYDAEFIAPIHDEVVYSVSDEDLVDCVREVHECMVMPYLKTVPVLSSTSIGKNFAKQYECGDTFSAESLLRERARVLAA